MPLSHKQSHWSIKEHFSYKKNKTEQCSVTLNIKGEQKNTTKLVERTVAQRPVKTMA
jgi:hypothetical protein